MHARFPVCERERELAPAGNSRGFFFNAANRRRCRDDALPRSRTQLQLHGWIFDIESGAMLALDGRTGKFLSLLDHPDIYAA